MIIVSRWLRKQSILKFPRQSNMNTKGNAVPAGKFLLDVTPSNSVPHPFHFMLLFRLLSNIQHTLMLLCKGIRERSLEDQHMNGVTGMISAQLVYLCTSQGEREFMRERENTVFMSKHVSRTENNYVWVQLLFIMVDGLIANLARNVSV